MKQLYNILSTYLPSKASHKYQLNPVFYIYDEYNEKVCAVYSFDKIKEVIYVSNYNKSKFWYMSLYEFKINNWKILNSNQFEKISYRTKLSLNKTII